jgi:hypothetical protein
MTEPEFNELRRAVVLEIARLAGEKYVYPDMGEKITARLRANLEGGLYDAITKEADLAWRLTDDLQSISSDRHWSVVYDPKGATELVDPESEADESRKARYAEMARRGNYGFERVERLKGNIGYIEVRTFEPAEYGGPTAVAAMNFVANCDALIIDLRRNHGGYPSMVQLITSYLYDPAPRHINTFYYRPTGDTQQFWTFPHVPGKRRPDIPVYVLISGDTGSGAEEFAYNLKHMKRATLIGETTAGAAHPVTTEIVHGDFDVRLPYGRPINPVTGTNWEGEGVEPDIQVPAEGALKTAHLKALERLIANCEGEDMKKYLVWAAEIIASEYDPITLGKSDLSRCVGEFGPRSFAVENGSLVYRHRDKPGASRLVPMSKTRFRLDEDLKFEFVLGADGNASEVNIYYRDGRPELIARRTG